MLFIERKLDNIDYVANATKTIQIPRDNVIRSLIMKLTGSITTDDDTAPTNRFSLTPYKLIKRIEIVKDGKDTIKSVPFFFYRLLHAIDDGVLPNLTVVPTAANTTVSFEATAIIPFCFTRAMRPVDGGLNPKGLSSLDLRVTWDNDTSAFYTTPEAETLISGVTLNTSIQEYSNIKPDAAPFLLNKHNVIEIDVTATNPTLQTLLATNRIYRRLMIYSEIDGVGANNVINNIQLKSGTFVYKEFDADVLRSSMKSYYKLSTLDDGVYMIEFISDGMISECLNTNGLSSFELILDVTKQSGTNKIYVFPEIVE